MGGGVEEGGFGEHLNMRIEHIDHFYLDYADKKCEEILEIGGNQTILW
jgi:hypothetical protein